MFLPWPRWEGLGAGMVSCQVKTQGYSLAVLVFSSAGCSGVLYSEWARGSLGNWFPNKGFIALYSWSPGKKEDGHPEHKQLSGTEGNVCIKQWRSMRTRIKVSFRASGVPWLFDLMAAKLLLPFACSVPPVASPGFLAPALYSIFFFVYCLLCTVNRRGSILYLPCVESAWPQNMGCLFHRGRGS